MGVRTSGLRWCALGVALVVGACTSDGAEVDAGRRGDGEVPPPVVSERPDADFASSAAELYLPVYRGGAALDGAPEGRRERAADALALWRSLAAAPGRPGGGPESEEEYRARMAESFGVSPEEYDAYLREATASMEASGIDVPDLGDLAAADPSESSFLTESATVCGAFAAVSLFPVVGGQVVALDLQPGAQPIAPTALPDGVDRAWQVEREGLPATYLWTTTEVPEVSLSVSLTAPACEVSTVLGDISVARG